MIKVQKQCRPTYLAVQWTGNNEEELREFIEDEVGNGFDHYNNTFYGPPEFQHLDGNLLVTHRGYEFLVSVGGWLCNDSGEPLGYYVYTDEDFKEFFEEVTE